MNATILEVSEEWGPSPVQSSPRSEGLTVGLTFCCRHLEILHFRTRGPAVAFYAGPCKLRSWSCEGPQLHREPEHRK